MGQFYCVKDGAVIWTSTHCHNRWKKMAGSGCSKSW